MSIDDLSNPERFVPLPYPTSDKPECVDKIFDDPDFIRLYLGDKKSFEVSWTTNANAVQSVDLLSEFAEQTQFETGTIALQHTFIRPGTVMGGANLLEGSAEDIMEEVQDAGERVIGYSLSNKVIEIAFRPAWPRTYHDIATNEVLLNMERKNRLARHIIKQTISLTAMDGLKNAADATLDEFAAYLPTLRR